MATPDVKCPHSRVTLAYHITGNRLVSHEKIDGKWDELRDDTDDEDDELFSIECLDCGAQLPLELELEIYHESEE